jgi:hypothetical protein
MQALAEQQGFCLINLLCPQLTPADALDLFIRKADNGVPLPGRTVGHDDKIAVVTIRIIASADVIDPPLAVADLIIQIFAQHSAQYIQGPAIRMGLADGTRAEHEAHLLCRHRATHDYAVRAGRGGCGPAAGLQVASGPADRP